MLPKLLQLPLQRYADVSRRKKVSNKRISAETEFGYMGLRRRNIRQGEVIPKIAIDSEKRKWEANFRRTGTLEAMQPPGFSPPKIVGQPLGMHP
jgi:hypothetical protein